MKVFLLFVLFMVLALLMILLGIILGEMGAWYFAWLLGTGVIVLVAAAGGILLDAQDEREAGAEAPAARGSRN